MDSKRKLFLASILAAGYYVYVSMCRLQVNYIRIINGRAIEGREKRRPKGVATPRTLMYYERVVLKLSDRTFRSHFRLTRSTFNNLCHLLGPIIARNCDGQDGGRPNTSIEKQILPVLWLLATPESYRYGISVNV